MSARITVAQVNARVNALVEAQSTTNELLAKLVAQVSAYSTPAAVVEITEAKSAKARKATPAKATAKAAPKLVSLATAQKRVDAGEDAWKITVKSTSGNAIPFGLVLRANKAQARKATNKASTGTSTSPFFAMSKKQLIADGSESAQAEIARREAKHASK